MPRKSVKSALPKLPLASVEWDFRELSETEVPLALAYELRRSHVGFCQSAPQHWLDEFPLFPTPWLCYEPDDRKACALDLPRFGHRPLSVCSATDERMWRRLSSLRIHPHGKLAISKWWLLRLDLDSDATEDDLVADFKLWLKGARAGRGPKRGKGGKRVRFDLLKALAAFRISQHLTYAEAQDFLGEGCKNGRFAKPEVWPFYEEKSGWSDAIKRAKSAIAEAGAELA